MIEPDLDLRPATEADRPFLWQLHRQTMRPYVEQTWGWNEADQRRRFDENFDPTLKQIILLQSKPIGMIEVEPREHEVFLAVIEILPEWQGRGLGMRLIRGVVEQAGDLPVMLRVLRANPARALYERLGFKVTGETTTHYEMRHGAEHGAADAA